MSGENINEQQIDSNNKFIYVTWQEVEDLINKKIPELKGFKDIYPLPRGGLVPGVILSHRLNLPFAKEITKETLVVDEICDSGKTFIELEEKLGFKPNTFCLHKKTISEYDPSIVCLVLDTHKWIIYPWENKA